MTKVSPDCSLQRFINDNELTIRAEGLVKTLQYQSNKNIEDAGSVSSTSHHKKDFPSGLLRLDKHDA